MANTVNTLLQERFGDAGGLADTQDAPEVWRQLAGRTSCRKFQDRPVPLETLKLVAAIALSTPSKSDLQQRDIVIVDDPELRKQLIHVLTDVPNAQTWITGVPALVVICGNNRRQRLLHEWSGIPFANDHLDAFYNPVLDAGIALAGFLMAAEAIGLGCCPISAVRNRPEKIGEVLGLPDHVFPAVGVAVGYRAEEPETSMRLPLDVTVHTDRYRETGLKDQVRGYDAERGAKDGSNWSAGKVRQYSRPERTGFGEYIRSKGFALD